MEEMKVLVDGCDPVLIEGEVRNDHEAFPVPTAKLDMELGCLVGGQGTGAG